MNNKIKMRRKKLNLTQQNLAEKMGTNVRWIQKLEAREINIENITFLKAIKLIKALTEEDDVDDDWKIAKECYSLLKSLLN